MDVASQLLLAHDYERAADVLATLYEQNPQLTQLAVLLGACYERADARPKARAIWRSALKTGATASDASSMAYTLVHMSGSLLAAREAVRVLVAANNNQTDTGDATLLDLVGILARDTGPKGAAWLGGHSAFRASQAIMAQPLQILHVDDERVRDAFERDHKRDDGAGCRVQGAPSLAVHALLPGRGSTYGPARQPPAPKPPRAWKANDGEVPPSALFSDRDVFALRCDGGAISGPCATLATPDGHLVVGGHLWSEPLKLIDTHALAAAASHSSSSVAFGGARRTVPSPCVALVSASLHNHYHAAAEGVSRIAFAEQAGILAKARCALLPPREEAPLVWEAYEAACLRCGTRPEPVVYNTMALHVPAPTDDGKVGVLWVIDWVPCRGTPDERDLWSTWQPPRAGFVLGTELLADAARRDENNIEDEAPPCIVYVRRRSENSARGTLAGALSAESNNPPRALRAADDDVITKAARTAAVAEGLAFRVFEAPAGGGSVSAAHINAMRGCVALLGPHGAGLVNAMFVDDVARNASRTLIELPEMPYVNPAYAQVSSSLGWAYDFVESVRSPHYGTYDLAESAAEDVAECVRRAAKRWRHGSSATGPATTGSRATLSAADVRASCRHVAM